MLSWGASMRIPAIVFIWAGLLVPLRSAAQASAECTAPLHEASGSPTYWTRGIREGAPVRFSGEDVRQTLAGEYDLHEIPTQGVPSRIAWTRRLVLVSPAAGAEPRCPFGPCTSVTPLIGAILPSGSLLSADSIALGRVPRQNAVEVMFSDSSQAVAIWQQPRTLDGGRTYDVLSVTPTMITGIWTDGAAGYIGQPIQLNGVRVFESLLGYFCAFRKPPH